MIKIRPEEAAILGFSESRMTLLHARERRYGCYIKEGFDHQPCPLTHIFVLKPGNSRRIERLSHREAFLNLTCNAAPGVWGLAPDEIDFSNLKSLVEKVPVYSFIREENLAALPEHARTIENFLKDQKTAAS